MAIFSANKTSARLLVDYAAEQWLGEPGKHQDPEQEKLYLITYDLYIKARSYAIINKTAFWLALVAGIMVLLWPSLAIITQEFDFDRELFKSAVVQTTVTGLAALTFAVYSHYKKRQVYVENLMRQIIYADHPGQELVERIMKEMERIDTGFSFTDVISRKSSK